MQKKNNIFRIIALLIIFIFIIKVLFGGFDIFLKTSKENIFELPHIKIELPNNYIPLNRMLSTGNETFILLGTKKIKENLYNTKVFLISSEGKILDEFEGSKGIAYLDNIETIGIVASDFSSPYVGGDIQLVLSIKNRKIIQERVLDKKISIFDSPHIKSESVSSNISLAYKCYISIDIENGGCNYGLTTIKVDDKIGYTSKKIQYGSIKIDKNHTFLLLKNITNNLYDPLILGPN
ncbi:MAG: hypothetical protein WC744_02060 [Patescibacteria group bacterium]|jgi:hypothetical protein